MNKSNIKKTAFNCFLVYSLFFFSIEIYSQSLVNVGASIMLQSDAVVYSEDSFLNQNNGQIQGDGTMQFATATNLGVLNPGLIIGNLSFRYR